VTRHPGGEEHTLEMLELSGLRPPERILDLGAGDGSAVRLLSALGYCAEGIDIDPGENVMKGDLLSAPYAEESFDGALSQCSFFVSGDPAGAFREAYRLLRRGGALMYSDVGFDGTETLEKTAAAAGFAVEAAADMTKQWKEYYIESIWRGDDCPGMAGRRCGYYMLICRKE
jgi:SAM-dependent methyltransferase